MYLQCILVNILLLTNVHSELKDCIDGEIWYEVCKKCICLGNGKYICLHHPQSCYLDKCIENVIIFSSNLRCHCAKNKTTVCVPLSYQGDLNGKSCTADTYYYDNCTYCICDQRSKKTKCEPIDNCDLSNGGVCNNGEVFMEKCYRCSCTYSKFRSCSILENCLTGEEKPGKCYYIQRFYPRRLQNDCISVFNQECYTDYGCPGVKKCCQIVDCYLRCVDPDF